jgi:hypothetical protein
MAELSDLKPDQDPKVGWIAYYNVVDNTDVTESDLTDGTVEENGDGPAEIETMISQNNENIDYYNNGVIVTYEGPTRIVTIRFKTDGWITAHMDRSKSYATEQSDYSSIDGVHDIVHWNDDVTTSGSNTDASESSLVTNTLERSIKTALEQMSIHDTKISSPYDPNDVKLYNYEFDTNNATLLSDAKIGIGNTYSYDFQYTDATQVQHVAIAGSAVGRGGTEIRSHTGTYELISGADRGSEWGAIDATERFKNLSSGQPYELTASLDTDRSNDWEYSLHVVVVWS